MAAGEFASAVVLFRARFPGRDLRLYGRLSSSGIIMGMDLYIEPVASRQRQACQAEFYEAVKARDYARVRELDALMWNPEFYFRDNYKQGNLCRVLGIDIVPLLTKRMEHDPEFNEEYEVSLLQGDGLTAFIAELESHPAPPGHYSSDYFAEQRERLLRFLKRAQEAGNYVRVSY
jgi:hypothetical protein